MTLTDEDREATRWFATACLGWHRCYDDDCCWQNGSFDETDLTGWPGFGRVVEYVVAQGQHTALHTYPDGRHTLIVWGGENTVERGAITHTDPAIAAIMAVRQAKEAGR